MTSNLYKYQIYCETDSKWEYVWRDSPPSICPVNNNHTVNSDTVSVVESINKNDISYGDGTIVDSYNRLRVSNSKNIMSFKQLYSTIPDTRFEYTSVDGGTKNYVQASALTELTTTTLSTSSSSFQTREYFVYQAGACFNIVISGLIGSQKTGSVQELGYYDDSNGLFFRMDGTDGLSVVHRTKTSGSVVDTVVLQNDWNTDTLNGSGYSGYNIDTSKTQFWWIDFQWQGTGRARFGIYNNGEAIVCHKFNFNNNLTTVYMSTPCLPVKFKIYNTATTASPTTMKAICVAVSLESSTDPTGFPFAMYSNIKSINNGTVGTGTDNFIPVISIRLKNTFKSVANRIKIKLESFSCLITGNSSNPCIYALIWNPVLTGAVFSDVNTEYSGTEYDITSTSLTGGVIKNTGVINNSTGNISIVADNYLSYNRFPLSVNANADNSIILCLAVKRLITNSAADASASLEWFEIY